MMAVVRLGSAAMTTPSGPASRARTIAPAAVGGGAGDGSLACTGVRAAMTLRPGRS